MSVSLSLSDLSKKLKEKEVLEIQDEGVFQYPTGDVYKGFFLAKKKDRSVKMHGPGVYTRAEGDVYSGLWDNDRFGISGTVDLSYVEGSNFKGQLKDGVYFGKANYTYPDGSVLMCNFSDNCPTGTLTLEDPNGHEWVGKADTGFCWFEPANHYYSVLHSSPLPTPRVKKSASEKHSNKKKAK